MPEDFLIRSRRLIRHGMPTTGFNNAKDYTNQAVNGIIGEANSNAAVSIKAADSEQDTETAAIAQSDARGALSSALSSSAKGDASTLNTANSNAQGYANTAQGNADGYATAGDKTTLASANQTSANGDATTLASANKTSATGDATTLASANTDAQVMANAAQSSSESYASTTAQADANAAQSNSEAYTNQSYQQANVNAKGYANQAQINSEQYAASGIAAALAMPSSPYLRPGHYAVGIQGATYGGEQGFGARATFQINDHWSANAGVAGGTGIYGQVGGAAGVQYEE